MSDRHEFLISGDPLDYYVTDTESLYQADQSSHSVVGLVHAVSGFRIPGLPVARESGLSRQAQLAQLLHRFVGFMRALHNPDRRGALALHVMAHPERSTLGAEVGVYLLCRTAAGSYPEAVAEVNRLAAQLEQLFPVESLFNYGTPIPLAVEELRRVTFQDVKDTDLQVIESRKFEDCLTVTSPASRFIAADQRIDYIPHPFWVDAHLDPWLSLIETLAGLSDPTVISICVEPTSLIEEELVATLGQQYRLIVEEGSRRVDLLDQAGQMGGGNVRDPSLLQLMSLARAYRAQGFTDYLVSRARRGAHVYNQLLAWQDQLFTMRISVAASGSISEGLVQAVRAALSAPEPEVEGAELGWVRPSVMRPVLGSEQAQARYNLRWLGQNDWGISEANVKLRRLRHLVTAKEAVGLFHLPVMPQAGQTTALSTADVPFVIPPEVVSTFRFKPEDKPLISLGFLYQRDRYLAPDRVGATRALDFKLRLTDFEKPSLLVGAPGSGKSNLALHLLIQLWRDYRVPFLVLDPSSGHEYRYLYSEPSLRDDLLVYTLGDEQGLPFRFNPFEVPPGVTVRGHITRLLACFKAAYEMWDPLPAIYEAALGRVYGHPPYTWPLDEKGGSGRASPTLAEFAQAVVDHLEANVLEDYKRGSDAAGILTGASKIRVNSILSSRGHILNVQQSDPDFFQRLLDQPVVIELGALGDPASIALIMAFLITQLAGHIEYAFECGAREKHPHLLLIEEAHRLLSAETVNATTPNQGNVRGKSADELNVMLAEVRKFRQGVMVLDQRPSSLVGGVLDNAYITIMCRLSDRIGFEHLSNVLNLSPAQQRYARTRLQPGEALMLDRASGQPVLPRAPNEIERLQKNRLPRDKERELMCRNAERVGLLPPPAKAGLAQDVSRATADQLLKTIWAQLDEIAEDAPIEVIRQAAEREDWASVQRSIRSWLDLHKPDVNRMARQAAFVRVAEWLGSPDLSSLFAKFQKAG